MTVLITNVMSIKSKIIPWTSMSRLKRSFANVAVASQKKQLFDLPDVDEFFSLNNNSGPSRTSLSSTTSTNSTFSPLDVSHITPEQNLYILGPSSPDKLSQSKANQMKQGDQNYIQQADSTQERERVGATHEVSRSDIRKIFPISQIIKDVNHHRTIEGFNPKIDGVRRPNLWGEKSSTTSTTQSMSYQQIGSFQRYSREELLDLMPEGLCGELARDIVLIPSMTRDVGIMVRKATVDICQQMQGLQKGWGETHEEEEGVGMSREEEEESQDMDEKESSDTGVDLEQESSLKATSKSDSDPEIQNQTQNNCETLTQQSCLSPQVSEKIFRNKQGWLLDGKKGVGKSAVLNHCVLWARENGWMVIYEPFLGNYGREIGEISRSNNGIYIQNEFAKGFLERTLLRNLPFFEEIPIDHTVYGRKRGVDAESINRSLSQYDELISHAVERDVGEWRASHSSSPPIDETRYRLQQWFYYRSKVKVPSMTKQQNLNPDGSLHGLDLPETLADLVSIGLDGGGSHSGSLDSSMSDSDAGGSTFATQTVAELFEQLKVQTKFNLLIAADEWNEIYPVSEYVSIRYDNTKFGGYIPSYHLSMPRNFLSFNDGKDYKRGVKLYSTSYYRMNRRNYKPQLVGVNDKCIKTVREFSQHEWANFCAYYQISKITQGFPRDKQDYFYMLTQGNGWYGRRMLSMMY